MMRWSYESARSEREEPTVTMADELEKLHRLVQSGALTTAEYEAAKARVLNGASSGPASA